MFSELTASSSLEVHRLQVVRWSPEVPFLQHLPYHLLDRLVLVDLLDPVSGGGGGREGEGGKEGGEGGREGWRRKGVKECVI